MARAAAGRTGRRNQWQSDHFQAERHPLAGDNQRCGFIGNGQQGFQFAQHAVGTPVFGELNGGFCQVSLMEFKFAFKQFEEGKGIRGAAGETGNDFVVIEAADFADITFMTVLPIVACPSPPITTWPLRRTLTIVVMSQPRLC